MLARTSIFSALYSSRRQVYEARRVLYTSHRPDLGHSLEILCVDIQTFAAKSQIGGVYAVASLEGRAFDLGLISQSSLDSQIETGTGNLSRV